MHTLYIISVPSKLQPYRYLRVLVELDEGAANLSENLRREVDSSSSSMQPSSKF